MKPFFQKFYPSVRAVSSYDIDYEGLYQAGIRGLIYDIDNTLVPHGAPADEKATLVIHDDIAEVMGALHIPV